MATTRAIQPCGCGFAGCGFAGSCRLRVAANTFCFRCSFSFLFKAVRCWVDDNELFGRLSNPGVNMFAAATKTETATNVVHFIFNGLKSDVCSYSMDWKVIYGVLKVPLLAFGQFADISAYCAHKNQLQNLQQKLESCVRVCVCG